MTSTETDYLKNHDYISNHRLLVLCGIWPYQKSSRRLLHTRIISVILLIGVIVQTGTLMIINFTLQSIIEIMETLLPSLTFTLCFCNICNNYVTVKLLFDCIRKKWNETDDENELKSMQKYIEETRFYLFIMSSIIFIYLILLTFPSIAHVMLYAAGVMNESKLILPFPAEYARDNKISFFLLLFIEYVIIITTCSIGVVYGTMHLSFVQHACTLFDITMIKVEEPFKKNPNKFCWVCPNNKRNEEYDWIVTVVKCYNEAINFVGLIKFVCEKTLLIESCLAFLFTIIDILYLMKMNNVMENLQEAIQNCIYISGTLILTYAYCYLGQKVIDHNNNLFIKCCQIPIYTLSLKTQKIILLLMTKIMRPCHFSVKGTLIISCELFLNVLRASYTFAMVFHNM